MRKKVEPGGFPLALLTTSKQAAYQNQPEEAVTKLLTKELRRTIPALYEQEGAEDPTVYLKLFTPWSRWTWLITEASARDQDGRYASLSEAEAETGEVIFFGLVSGNYEEFGYVGLSELESLEGSFGVDVERDLHFRPKPLSKARAELRPHPRE